MAASGSGHRAIVAALGASVSRAVATIVGFMVTGSASMLAESIHSMADSANQVLLLGSKRAAPDETELHQFGLGRERYFWSFVVAIVVFLLGALYALFEGWDKIVHRDEHGITRPWIAVGILVFGLVVEGWSVRTAIVESNTIRGTASWRRFIRKARMPELPVVLLEGAGAITGLTLALGGVILSAVTDNAIWDGIATVLIGLLLGIIAIVLAVEMKSLLVGESATVADQKLIVEAIESAPSVRSLVHMRTQHVGPDELLVAARVEFDANLPTAVLASAITGIEERVRAVVPIADPMYIEPDVRATRSERSDRSGW